MLSEDDHQLEFFEDFPELLHPEANLHKELLAHFGLLFSGYALLEASLHNCLLVHEKTKFVATSRASFEQEWVAHHNRVEQLAYASTFGSLLKRLKGCSELDPVRTELEKLKVKRDYFAHHFFRETADLMSSPQVIIEMMHSMGRVRARAKACERTCKEIGLTLFTKVVGKAPTDADLEQVIATMESHAEIAIRANTYSFGWEDKDAL